MFDAERDTKSPTHQAIEQLIEAMAPDGRARLRVWI